MARSILAVTLAVANAIAVPAAVAQTPQTTQTIGMARAVAIAQEARPGGILEAELDSDLGALVYEIEIVSDGTIHEAVIDARSGELIELEEHTIEATWLGWPPRSRPAEPCRTRSPRPKPCLAGRWSNCLSKRITTGCSGNSKSRPATASWKPT